MKTIRVFVSSPGDVQAERTIADRLIRTIAEELAIPVSVQYSNLLRNGEAGLQLNSSGELESGELILCPYFWEYQRFSPEFGYQDQIPNTAQFDLVISILWSRLGTKLHPRFHMPDGSEPRSGTEFEIAWAKEQRAKTPGVPALHVYRNRSQPNPPLDPPEKRDEFFRQWDSLKGFFESWEKDSEGQFVGAFNNYNNLEEFERLFREHFRDFLSTQISGERNRRWLAQRSQVRRWKQNPFRGLQIFEFEHAPIFAGRTLAIDGVLTALTQQAESGRSFVLVLGASGSGKSSLVRAGVLPLLVEPGVIEGIGLWRRSEMRPGAGGSQSDVFDALAAGLLAGEALPELADLESKEPVKNLAVELRTNPQGVADRVKDKLNQVASEYRLRQEQRLRELESGFREQKREADAANARLQREKLAPPRARLALVVDQLEELFTSGFSEELQLKFVNSLAVLARSGRVFVLVTLRNDFYARYQQFTDLVELTKPSGKYDLQPPTPQELGRMIRLPAQAAGLEFERDEALGQTLDEALRDGAAADPQALPLLEHVLTRLYELQEKRGDRILSWSDYRKLGEMNGALANHAEEVFGTLRPDEQAAFPLAMGYLVTLGQGEEEVLNRRTSPYHDFLGRGDADHKPRTGAQGFVDRFIEKRLLVADTDPHGEITVSVAHEALLREWVRVKSWLAGNREFLRMRDRLDSSLRLWLSRGKQKDDLLGPGLPVAEGERLVKEFARSLSREEIDYIKASTAERKRREQARTRQFQGAATVLFVLLCAALVSAYVAMEQSTSAAKSAQQARKTAVLADFDLSSLYLDRTEPDWSQALAHLARGLRTEPENAMLRQSSVLILTNNQWYFLSTEPLQHSDKVNAASFSPDGARIVTASADKTARVWDAQKGNPVGQPLHHDGAVNAASFSPDGNWIVTASDDNSARIWDAKTGNPVGQPLHHGGAVNAANFSPDGARIVTASDDKSAQIWDAKTGNPVGQPIHHDDKVNAASFSPDGARIVTASDDKSARIWDAKTGNPVGQPIHHDGAVNAASFSPDGNWIVTASDDNSARIWDAKTGNPVGQPLHHDATVNAASFNSDGTRILTASLDHTARVWDASTRNPIGQALLHNGPVYSASFSPDGARIVTASGDQTARLWDAQSGVCQLLHHDTVRAASFSPDGTRIVTASFDRTARLWDARTGKPIGQPLAHDDEVYAASFSPDGARILTATGHGTARLWDAQIGNPVGQPLHDDHYVNAASFSPDGTLIVTASEDQTARIWKARTGEPIGQPLQHNGPVYTARFSPDGTLIVTASGDQTARIWDARTGKPLLQLLHHDKVRTAGFSPDGTLIVTASDDQTARIWDASKGNPVGRPLHHDDFIAAAGFSPDGTLIVTASQDHTARIWKAKTGEPIGQPLQHNGPVYTARFSPDGTRIVTASEDHTARIWDARTGKPIGELLQHNGPVYSASFSPDGTQIVTASWDHTARIWDVAVDFKASLPKWFPVLLEALGGKRLNEQGSLVDGEREQGLLDVRKQLLALKGDDFWSRLGHWFAVPGPERTISPNSTVTVQEWEDNQHKAAALR